MMRKRIIIPKILDKKTLKHENDAQKVDLNTSFNDADASVFNDTDALFKMEEDVLNGIKSFSIVYH